MGFGISRSGPPFPLGPAGRVLGHDLTEFLAVDSSHGPAGPEKIGVGEGSVFAVEVAPACHVRMPIHG